MIAPTRGNGRGRGALLSFAAVVQRTRIVTAGSVSPASSLSSALDQPPKITQNCDFPCRACRTRQDVTIFTFPPLYLLKPSPDLALKKRELPNRAALA